MTPKRTEKMDQALVIIVDQIKKELAVEINPSFELSARVHPLTCSEECIFAGAQRVRIAAEAVLVSAQSRNDYYLEKAALLLVELLKANEQLARFTAELHQTYSSADLVNDLVPYLEQMTQGGHQMFASLVDKGLVIKKSDNA